MDWNKGRWEYRDMAKTFKHEEIELKQLFLKLARDFYRNEDNKIENELAAAVLYMNLADYLAEYLVTALTEMVKEAIKTYYLGAISFTPPQSQKFNIETSIHVLERYDFVKKTEIMAELKEVKEARNKVAHQLLKVKAKDLHTIDSAVSSLQEHTEALVVLVDEIDLQIPPTNVIDLIKSNSPQK